MPFSRTNRARGGVSRRKSNAITRRRSTSSRRTSSVIQQSIQQHIQLREEAIQLANESFWNRWTLQKKARHEQKKLDILTQELHEIQQAAKHKRNIEKLKRKNTQFVNQRRIMVVTAIASFIVLAGYHSRPSTQQVTFDTILEKLKTPGAGPEIVDLLAQDPELFKQLEKHAVQKKSNGTIANNLQSVYRIIETDTKYSNLKNTP